uniref:Uncharacterized protein n=1 Tax=Cacopsylla melanoneura TaxID=428564 RepID=A0A8D8TAN3_9HEMI
MSFDENHSGFQSSSESSKASLKISFIHCATSLDTLALSSISLHCATSLDTLALSSISLPSCRLPDTSLFAFNFPFKISRVIFSMEEKCEQVRSERDSSSR